MINFTIKDKTIYLESDSKDNPLIPHLDSDGNNIAKFEPPYTIVEGISAKVNGKTTTLAMSGKKGNFITVKMPTNAILALANAINDLDIDDNPITKETLEDLINARDSIQINEV